MKFYIAGGMKGYEKHNFPAFDAARDRLLWIGHQVASPADGDRAEGNDETTSDDFFNGTDINVRRMRWNVDRIFEADGLYMLKAWERSEGARVEHALAVMLGKIIVYETDDDLIEEWRAVAVGVAIKRDESGPWWSQELFAF